MGHNPSGPVLDAVYPAQPPWVAEIRRAVSDVATGAGADALALIRINLAVSEAATNAILHAYRDRSVAGDVRVLVEHADDVSDVSICDQGVGMSPRADSPGMGLGLCLMAHEADSFEIKTSRAGGTEVFLRFALDAADGANGGNGGVRRC